MQDKKEDALTYEDLMLVISNAASAYRDEQLPVYIKNERGQPTGVESRYAPHVCMFEAVVNILNNKGFLNTIPTFKKGR